MLRTRVKLEETVRWAVTASDRPGGASIDPFDDEATALEHAARLLDAGAGRVEITTIRRSVEVVWLEKGGAVDGG